ncbi:MAG TPA: L,D-transpeptidase family protein, partial [Niastella sp.]|nr:L,D-transpeptidase family protein [Niastella sp.]
MKKCINSGLLWCLFIVAFSFVACHGRGKTAEKPEKPKEKDIVEQPEALSVSVVRNIQTSLEFILASNGVLNDSMVLAKDSFVNDIYQKKNFEPVWSNQEKWLPLSDSLFEFLGHATEYGLFPSDYHYGVLENIRTKTTSDALGKKDAALWARGEILLTDAFFRMIFDLRKGRLPADSVTLRKDSMTTLQYLSLFDTLWQNKDVASLMHALEPKHLGYDSLKTGLQTFLKSAEPLKKYTYVPYPALNSAEYYNILKQRLFEEGLLNSPFDYLDTTSMKLIIGRYQREKGLTETGKLNSGTVSSLNNTSWEKFKRIAITLDRFKLLPDSMPTTYIWVNIPAYRMKVMDSGNVAMESNVIVGQPRTRTPLLTSNLTNFITYPQWTVPYSIIFGEMLSRIKANPDYLRRQNLMVVDKNDSVMNADSLNWKKFNKNYFP